MSDGIFQYILTETQSTRIVKAGGYDSHLPLLFIYHRRSQFTDFFSYSQLCGAAELAVVRQPEPAADTRPVAMEKLVRELIRDRLLTLSRYITLDSSTRTILIDQTSLSADGYQVVTH